MRNLDFIQLVACSFLVSIFCVASPALGVITVEGVAEKKVYANTVSFRVPDVAGYDTTVNLNGAPEPTGVLVPVNDADYYELHVERTNQTTHAKETLLIRFIVKNTTYADTEWGLPGWIPYPDIDSAAAEYAGSRLDVVAPARFPKGIEVPVVFWVRDATEKRVGLNGLAKSAAFPGADIRLHRGVGAGLLPAPAAAGDVAYDPQMGPLSQPHTITVEDTTTWKTVSGTISANTDWGEDARIDVTAKLTVAAAATLTIGAGTVVRVAPKTDIEISGKILVNGTADRPVVFTPQRHSAPWGGFLFRAATSVADMHFALMVSACADPNWFPNNPGSGGTHLSNQCQIYMSNGAHVTLTDCALFDSKGQAGHGESSFLTMTRSLYQRFYTGGAYNGGKVTLDGCATIEFPLYGSAFLDDDNDAIYLTGRGHSVTNHLSGWCHDDALDSGSGPGGPITVHHNWHESAMHEAFAWSSGNTPFRQPDVRDCVTINCDQGDEDGWVAGGSECLVVEDHCLHTGNMVGIRLGDNYDWTYAGGVNATNSLLLYNYHNVWAQTWDKPNWTTHLADVHVSSCYLSEADPLYPNNSVWNPETDAALLVPFLPTPATVVGIGIATWSDTGKVADLAKPVLFKDLSPQKGVPVRLSTFTTKDVSVDYSIDSDAGSLGGGTLTFVPGETVKNVPLPDVTGRTLVQVTLSNPVDGELTGRTVVTYTGPRPPVRFVRGDANNDQSVDIADAITILFYLFAGRTIDCVDACDVNDNGTVSIDDPIYVLQFLFTAGNTIPPPYPTAGSDPTNSDSLNCSRT